MKKIAFFILICIFTAGIAANANIHTSDNAGNQFVDQFVISAQATDPATSKSSPNPMTVGVLLGVGIVGLVTFSRRD